MPAIPDTLRQPEARAGYLIEHFWDNLDFVNDTLSVNPDIMEQSFVNYLSVFPIANKKSREEAIRTLVERSSDNLKAFDIVCSLAEKYFYNLDSPNYSENTYEVFIDNVIANTKIDEVDKIRYRYHKDAISKNRVGSAAHDFQFTDEGGKIDRLYDIETPDNLLLIFYDPDCDHCASTIRELASDSFISSLIADKGLVVVSIYSGDDYELWVERHGDIPQIWIDGFEDGTIQEEGCYIFRTMPTIFLLNDKKEVLLKEASVEELKNFLK